MLLNVGPFSRCFPSRPSRFNSKRGRTSFADDDDDDDTVEDDDDNSVDGQSLLLSVSDEVCCFS